MVTPSASEIDSRPTTASTDDGNSSSHLVLLTFTDGTERLEPLVELGPDGVTVLVRARLAGLGPGGFLPRMRFFNEGECTLECRGTVRENQPVRLASGTHAMRLELALEIPESESSAPPPTDTYDEPQIISDTLANVVKTKAKMRLFPHDGTVSSGIALLRFSHVAPEKGTFRVGVKAGEDLDEIVLKSSYELRGEIYGTRIALVATLTRVENSRLFFEWPSHLTVWRHRVGGRVRRMPGAATVSFDAPFRCREHCTREVVDVSARGVAFYSETSDGMLVGMLLPELEIQLPDGTVRSRAVVRNVRQLDGRLLVGTELKGLNRASERILESFVDRNLHPAVRSATPNDLRRLWHVYEGVGFFERAHAAVTPRMAAMETTRKLLLSRGKDLALHVLAGNDDEIVATAELTRTHRQCWTLHNVGSMPTAQIAQEALVTPLVEAAVRRKDFEYFHTIVDPQHSSLGLHKLRSTESDPAELQTTKKILFIARSGSPPVSDIQEAGPGDKAWILERLDASVPLLTRQALDMNSAELRLDSIRRAYHNAGLERLRSLRLSFSVTGPLGFSLLETTSPGVSFDAYLDMVRLFPARKDGAGRREALLALARDANTRLRAAGRERMAILLDPDDAEYLVGTEFHNLGSRLEIIATRPGVAQIVNFLNLLV